VRKVIFFMLVSLDGFFEGENHGLDWHNVDEEFNEFSHAQLDSAGMLLFGRRTYELMAGFWPTATASRDDPVTAAAMNRLPKIVFSRTLTNVNWDNTRLVKENIADEIRRLKAEPGKDLFIFGSSNLSVGLLAGGLIDELRILVNPVVLGSGTALFDGIRESLKLRLVKSQSFHSGNVLLVYRPELKQAGHEPR
jgi:dihydrofolate reductase